jgi:N-acetyl-gamma-glutamyl-phosphate reductase
VEERLRVGIIGAAGYTGAELLRFVVAHPRLELRYVAARDNAGKPLEEVLPGTTGTSFGELVLESFVPGDAAALARRIDVAFTTLPHGTSASVGAALFDAGVTVVDLSADFRLRDCAAYERTYGPHPAPHLLERAVYGLPELHRDELRGARLIAAPGCYPTSAILPLAPLLRLGLIEPSGIIIDSKSGVSGAGRKPGHPFADVAESIRAYKVGGTHHHVPEIEQELSLCAKAPLNVAFTPHLVPMTRGLLSVAYARPTQKLSTAPETAVERCREAAIELYAGGLVSVLAAGKLPDTLWVRGSARAHVAYVYDRRVDLLIAMGAIDNLARGASAQMIQALNASLGFPDALGLPELGLSP